MIIPAGAFNKDPVMTADPGVTIASLITAGRLARKRRADEARAAGQVSRDPTKCIILNKMYNHKHVRLCRPRWS
jgi:hypothetical protein